MTDDQGSEPDFIEFSFADEESARRAGQNAGFAANVGEGRFIAREAEADAVRFALVEAGLAWTEQPSGITEADMWPSDGDGPDHGEDAHGAPAP